jgi:geranylgeranyl diphosphate synthase, type II
MKMIPADMANTDQTFESYRQRVEDGLSRLLPDPATPPAAIHEAMRYCLDAGGKRLRPVLLLAAADLYPRACDAVPAAVAVECLHTYSLVHDDLPAMDNSPLRRGRPAAHVAFDEATAILVGDALLTEAFRLLATHYEALPARALALVRCLAEAADSRHLIGGQVVDTLSENRDVPPETLDFIHRHKTADLLTASLIMGLHLTEAPPQAFACMEKAGRAIGLAFQIIDDILDATSTAEVLGKTTGNDARRAKNTYVSVHGMESSRTAARRETAAAVESLEALPGARADFLVALVRKLEFRLA